MKACPPLRRSAPASIDPLEPRRLMSLPPAPIDRGFGHRGNTLTDLGGTERVSAVVVQSDDKIVVAGGTSDAPPNLPVVRPEQPMLVRYTRRGRLDRTFGDGAVVRLDVDSHGFNDVVVMPDGRIVAVATRVVTPEVIPPGTPLGSDTLVARFLPDGSPDPSFGTDGVAVLDLAGPGNDEAPFSVAVDAEGRVVIAGSFEELRVVPGGAQGLYTLGGVARVTASGAADTTFGGGDGIVTGIFGDTGASVSSVLVQPDGKILVGGTEDPVQVTDSTEAMFGVARFNPDGTPDASFGGGDGTLATLVDGRRAGVRALLLRPDGRIVAVGNTIDVNGSADREGAFVEFNPDGTIGPAGMLLLDPPGATVLLTDAALGTDGSVIAGGTLAELPDPSGPLDPQFGVVRLAPDGTFSFGGRNVSPGIERREQGDAMAMLPDGKVVLAGAAMPRRGDSVTWDVALVGVRPGALRPPRAAPTSGRNAPVTFANGASMRLDRRGVLTVRGTGAAETIGLKYKEGTFFEGPPLDVTINGETKSFDAWSVAQVHFKRIVLATGAGDDTVTVDANVSLPTRIDGGAGNDVLVGGSGGDLIFGGVGNDTLRGRAGADRLLGGPGDDGAEEDPTDLLVRVERRDAPAA